MAEESGYICFCKQRTKSSKKEPAKYRKNLKKVGKQNQHTHPLMATSRDNKNSKRKTASLCLVPLAEFLR